MKKINCALLLSFTLFSQGVFSNTPREIINFQKAKKTKLKMDLNQKVNIFGHIQKETMSLRSEVQQLGGSKYKSLQSQFEKIAKREDLGNIRKEKMLRDLLKKHENYLKQIWAKSSYDQKNYQKLIKKYFPHKKYKINSLGAVALWSPEPQGEPALSELNFSAPYSYPYIFEEKSGLVGMAKADVDKEAGTTYASSMMLYTPSSLAVAGVTERLELPAGVSEVRISAHLFIEDAQASTIGLGGVGFASATSFLEIYAGNQELCKETFEITSSLSSVMWIHATNKTQALTLTCDVNVANLSEIIINTGGETFASGAFNGGGTTSLDTIIENIDVEFLY